MKIQELRLQPKEDLKNFLLTKTKKLGELRFQLKSGKIKNIKEIREIKKDIAKIKTLLNEK